MIDGNDLGQDRPIRLRLGITGVTLDVPADRSILDVLVDHGFDVESVCRQGVCGTCEMRVLSGVPDHRDSILEESERLAGETMMICVSRALTDDLSIEF
jgi:ferredoxin